MNKLKEHREKKGWTQSQLASVLEVSEDYVSMLERGVRNPSFSLSKRIAKTFECTFEDVFPS